MLNVTSILNYFHPDLTIFFTKRIKMFGDRDDFSIPDRRIFLGRRTILPRHKNLGYIRYGEKEVNRHLQGWIISDNVCE